MNQPVLSATGLLKQFNDAGVLGYTEVQLAQTLGRLYGCSNQSVLLAAGLTVKALSGGSVCLELNRAEELAAPETEDEETPDLGQLPWPELSEWLGALEASPMVGLGEEAPANQAPLRLVDGQLYLEKQWLAQREIRDRWLHRWHLAAPPVDEPALVEALATEFPAEDPRQADAKAAVETAVRAWTSVITGGPGTGKTHTVAILLRVLATQGVRRVALAALTGKAAARLSEASPEQPAVTLHRLLGARGLGNGYQHNASNPLPYQVVLVDETSMVSLELMRALLEALRDDTRLILVGDAMQLQSVESGAVLADIVAADLPINADSTLPSVTRLTHNWRNATPVADLAKAVQAEDPDAVLSLLRSRNSAEYPRKASLAEAMETRAQYADRNLVVTPNTEISAANEPAIEFVEASPGKLSLTDLPGLTAELLRQGESVRAAALMGDGEAALQALGSHRLLCAHQGGPAGVERWSGQIRGLLGGRRLTGAGEWWPGRAVLQMQNNNELGIYNGDQGIAIETAEGLRVDFGADSEGERRLFPPLVLEGLAGVYAMTVHKSQGSQFDSVTLVLPDAGSPLLTVELLYTAITRAKTRLRIIGTAEAIEKACLTRAMRASGLARQLSIG